MKLLLFPVRALASNQQNGLSLPRSYQSKESKYFSDKSIISNIKTFFRMKEICFNKTSQGSAMEGGGAHSCLSYWLYLEIQSSKSSVVRIAGLCAIDPQGDIHQPATTSMKRWTHLSRKLSRPFEETVNNQSYLHNFPRLCSIIGKQEKKPGKPQDNEGLASLSSACGHHPPRY